MQMTDDGQRIDLESGIFLVVIENIGKNKRPRYLDHGTLEFGWGADLEAMPQHVAATPLGPAFKAVPIYF
ncbi:hypothetical protein ACIGW0_30340 [Streptomyces bikiniensis]|uniref:Uncharacterized protein n=1 Tax=Streptomyces bikiniensis TaxID=1896 RepID=A0ABW8D1B9_STRBI